MQKPNYAIKTSLPKIHSTTFQKKQMTQNC